MHISTSVEIYNIPLTTAISTTRQRQNQAIIMYQKVSQCFLLCLITPIPPPTTPLYPGKTPAGYPKEGRAKPPCTSSTQVLLTNNLKFQVEEEQYNGTRHKVISSRRSSSSCQSQTRRRIRSLAEQGCQVSFGPKTVV